MKYFITFLILLFYTVVHAQQLTGIIENIDTKQPVYGVSVFISNTSKGTISSNVGYFTITNFPTGKYDVVFSCIGFKTEIISVFSNQLPLHLTVSLTPISKLLDEVVVRQYEKDGWQKWGKFFIENFIGTSLAASQTSILNKEVIGFVHNKKQNTLQAYASEPLMVENKYLGYTLVYELKEFEFNFSNRIFYYVGYPLFQEMRASNNRIQKRWLQHRQEVYEGSLMHFMRCFYRNKLIENGFEVRNLVKQTNAEKSRIKAMMKMATVINGGFVSNWGGDSSKYYQQVLKQPDEIAFLDKNIYPADSFGYAMDSTTALLEFDNYLHFTYIHKKPPASYFASKGFINNTLQEKVLLSQVVLPKKQGLQVFSNGSFFNGKDLLTMEYWAWSEKIASMLPFDYKPPKESKLL